MSIIGVTERSRFKRCRRMWQYQDRDHLQKPVDRPDARWVGRGIHAALAGHYRGDNAFESLHQWLNQKLLTIDQESLSSEDRQVLADRVALMEGLLTTYLDFVQTADSFQVQAVEQTLTARIPGTRGKLQGTVDLIVVRGSRLWIVDHKTVSGFVESNTLDLDDQMTAYLWLIWKTYGELPLGAIYNQIRKKLPAEPHLLASGKGLSKSMSIDTTEEKYRQAILKHGFDPNDYTEVLTKLKENEFVRRDLVPRNRHELVTFEAHLVDEYREMAGRSTRIYPNATRECSWCDYLLLCKAQNEGGDVESLRDALFVVDPERRL